MAHDAGARRAAVRVFWICQIVYTIFWTPYIMREHFPALTLASKGTLNVERYVGWTDDIFSFESHRAFINNNPGASITAAIPLVLLRPVLDRIDEWNRSLPRRPAPPGDGEIFTRTLSEGRAYYFLAVAFVTVALVLAPATAAVMAYFAHSLMRWGVTASRAAAAAILCGIGTPLLFRSGTLNHNLLVADAGFAALLVLWDAGSAGASPVRAAVAGLLAGYAFLCDYSGAVVLLTAAVYAWFRGKPGRMRMANLFAFGAGAFPGIACLFAYQWWAFGSFLRPSQQYMPAISLTAHGYRGFGWPSFALARALLFDPRFGLLAYCPLLGLAIAVPFCRRVRERIPRLEGWVAFAYFALFLLFCSANQYSWLQPLTGFRYLSPVVPVMAVFALAVASALPPVVRFVAGTTALAQSFVIAAGHTNDVREEFAVLVNRKFALLWMSRLAEAGTPGSLVRVLGVLAIAGLGWAFFHTMRLLFTACFGESNA